MKFEYDQITINYQQYGSGPPLILLHGWGANLNTFDSLIKYLEKNMTIYAFDLPGFGESSEPLRVYGVNDYYLMLKAFIEKNNIKNPHLLAHSFGGRISLRYARFHDIGKLILVASAGVSKKSVKVLCKIVLYKIKKKWCRLFNHKKLERLYQKSGSRDYREASPMMKKILSEVVKDNQIVDAAYIKAETLIIWGACDKTTPLRDAHLLKRKIKNSGLVIFETAGHFCYLEERLRFNIIVENFLQGENKHIGGK